MPNSTLLISSFASGEWSPKLFGRVDMEKYPHGCETLENIIVDQYGGANRRPGTMFVIEGRDSNHQIRVIAFQFSTLQSYIIEMGHNYMRFFKNDGAILEGTQNISAITKANPGVVTINSHGYSNGDVLFITGVGGMTQLNGRFFTIGGVTTNTFQLTGVDTTNYTTFTSGGTVARVYTIATPYSGTDIFSVQFAQSADTMYLTHSSYAQQQLTRTAHTAWTIAAVVFTNGPFLDTNLTATTITASADTGANISLTASVAIFQAGHVGAFFRVKSGYVLIKVFNSTTVVHGDVQVVDGVTGNLATSGSGVTDWSEGAWSAVRGYPACVCFFEQRLFFANSTFQPQTLWGSRPSAFTTFTPGSADGDALNFTIFATQMNAIKWFSPGKTLVMGTSSGDFNMSSGSLGSPLTPSNVIVKLENVYGSTAVIPKRIGTYVYYIQRNKKTMRELSYNFYIDALQAVDMTLYSEHITGPGIVDMDYQQSPQNVLWCVRFDGQIATLTRQIEEQVIAWSRQKTDGLFESVAVMPSIDGTYDEVWFVVNRTINGVTKRYIEYLAAPTFTTQADAFYVDCGLTYSGVSTSTLSPLNHLEAKTIQVLNNGAASPDKTVANGSVTLDLATTKSQAGLQFISTITTLRHEGGSGLGTSQGKNKRPYEITGRFYNTLGCKIGNKVKQDVVQFRRSATLMDGPPALFSGDKAITPPQGYDKDGQITIIQDQPLPMNLLALFLKFYVGDR